MRRKKAKTVWDAKETDRVRAAALDGIEGIERIIAGTHQEKNPLKQNALLKRHGSALIEYALMLSELNAGLISMSLAETPNSNLPWGQDEDELLVSLRAQDLPLQEIASSLGRTPAACATRLSTLIGIPRTEVVERYLDGTLNEVPINGMFRGKVKKVSP